MTNFSRLLDQNQLPQFKRKVDIISPVNGRVNTLDQSTNDLHRQRLFGEGAWVTVSGYQVVSPIAGVVLEYATTNHRIRLKDKHGLRIQIDCGKDIHQHYGEGFKRKVSIGQQVNLGEPLFDFEPRKLQFSSSDIHFAVTLLNSDKVKGVVLSARKVRAGEDPVFSVII